MNYQDEIDEALNLLEQGRIDDGLRFTGEALAHAGDALASGLEDSGRYFLDMAFMHLTFLQQQGMAVEALSCGLMSMVTADARGLTREPRCRMSLTRLLGSLVISEMMAVDSLPLNDENYDLGRRLTSLTGILLTDCLSHLTPAQLDDPSLRSLDVILSTLNMTADIDRPAVIDGVQVEPSDVKTYLAEMLGVASQLGILQID